MPREMAVDTCGTPHGAPAGKTELSANQKDSPQAGRSRYWERWHKTNSTPITEVIA